MPLEDPVITRALLKVNGQIFNAWKSISINRSITQIAGSFSFTTSNRYAGENEKWKVEEGDNCSISIEGETVLTGFIDDIDDGYNKNSHDITFSGRDKTGDLVDCPYDVFTYSSEFKYLSFLQIIEKLASSLGIETVLDSNLTLDSALFKLVPSHINQTGEMIYESIAYYCQQHGVLPITTGDGKLYITRAGLARAHDKLEVGKNIKANRVNRSLKDRYSVYYAEGQTQTTAYSSKLIAEGKATDEFVASKRTRPLIILVGDKASDDLCQKRAAWEARIRMGASRKVETTVRGWTQTNKELWPLNGLVQMNDNKVGVRDELLIAGISLNLDGTGGELTTMNLVHPDTFILKQNEPVTVNEGLNARKAIMTEQEDRIRYEDNFKMISEKLNRLLPINVFITVMTTTILIAGSLFGLMYTDLQQFKRVSNERYTEQKIEVIKELGDIKTLIERSNREEHK